MIYDPSLLIPHALEAVNKMENITVQMAGLAKIPSKINHYELKIKPPLYTHYSVTYHPSHNTNRCYQICLYHESEDIIILTYFLYDIELRYLRSVGTKSTKLKRTWGEKKNQMKKVVEI